MQQDKYDKALKIFIKIYNIQNITKTNQFFILTLRSNIAAVFFKQGKFHDTLNFYQEIINYNIEIHGTNHNLKFYKIIFK